MEIESIKRNQKADLISACFENRVDFGSMERLVKSERLKKLQKRNHYIQQTIDSEIEKAIENENK